MAIHAGKVSGCSVIDALLVINIYLVVADFL